MLVSIGMGLAGGLLVGLLLRLSSRFLPFMAPLGAEDYFDDDFNWKVAAEDAEASEGEELQPDLAEGGELDVQVIGKLEAAEMSSTLKSKSEPGCMDRCLPFGRAL